jgi:midasin
LLRIHIGDQTDSKSLLGGYVCDVEPGKFRWQSGILTTAVQDGYWLLVEDIDKASSETLSMLRPLLETRQLFIPSRGECIKAHESFRMFATTQSFKLDMSQFSLWIVVQVDAPSLEEIRDIFNEIYPSIAPLWPSISNSYKHLQTFYNGTPGIGRNLTLRDFMKLSTRLQAKLTADDLNIVSNSAHNLPLELREKLYTEAVTCYTSFIHSKVTRHQAIDILSQAIDIPSVRAEFFQDHYTPHSRMDGNRCEVGQAVLRVKESSAHKKAQSLSTFAATRSSLCMLEKIATCVALVEPVLLVGESGTGKTTIIQYLANLTSNKLHVMNLSQQTDLSDILGGFKPVEPLMVLRPVLDKFHDLFGRTFSAANNAKFLDSVNMAFRKKKHEVVLRGLENSIAMAEKVLGVAIENATDATAQVNTGTNALKWERLLMFSCY